MNVTYTGRHGELPPDRQRKLDVKFAKLAKLIERKGADKGAHVVITTERHLTNAEVTVNFYDHSLVGVGSDSDFFTAVCAAIERTEKQALKVRAKWRDTKRGPKDKSVESAPEPVETPASKNRKSAPGPTDEAEDGRIFRVNHHERRKPMTLEEATIAIGDRDYMVYRDTDRDRVSVLIRRKDGNFDLVES
jgi:putative sigma-54 modulation protein